MSLVGTLLLLPCFSTYFSSGGLPGGSGGAKRPSVRFYITTKAMLSSPEVVSIFGASNLPPGSVLTVYLYDYIGEGSQIFNTETRVVVGQDGLFKTVIGPKPGLSFRTNLVCDVVFSPTYPPQPKGVTQVVGRAGEQLGTNSTNPQIQGNDRLTMLADMTVVRD